MTNDLTAIVLAGGKSSRMGEDKALIPINGVPLLQLVCRVAQACAKTVYIVTPWQERYQDIVPSDCEFIQEVPFEAGPLVGFAQGLKTVKTEWVLLLACDMPKLQVEVLQAWASQLDHVALDCIASLTRTEKGWEPLCGFYRRSCLSQLVEYINHGERSFQGWLGQHQVHVLALADEEMLFNCNTPEDVGVVTRMKDE